MTKHIQSGPSMVGRGKYKTEDVFVKHGCSRQQQKSKYGRIILTPPHPQGHVMSVKCEQPSDELTVQVWLLYDHPNCKYYTLFGIRTELRTDKQTDDPIPRPSPPPQADLSGRDITTGYTSVA